MSQKKNYPPYMKSSVSAQFLAKNPIYKKIFMKCPICAKFSLKPVGLSTLQNPQKIKDTNERHCTICGYIHVSNLVVSTTESENGINKNIIKEGRILEDQNNKK